jgi:hypothetical protein
MVFICCCSLADGVQVVWRVVNFVCGYKSFFIHLKSKMGFKHEFHGMGTRVELQSFDRSCSQPTQSSSSSFPPTPYINCVSHKRLLQMSLKRKNVGLIFFFFDQISTLHCFYSMCAVVFTTAHKPDPS